MNTSFQKGFGAITLILVVAAGSVMYFVKNEKGVSYLEDVYVKAKYYVVDRNADALEKAKEAKKMIEAEQERLKKIIEE